MKRLRSGRLIGPPDAGAETLEKKVVTLQQQLRALQDTARERHETLRARLLACEAARSADVARLSTLELQLAALISQVGRLEGASSMKGASSSSAAAGRPLGGPALPSSQYLASIPFYWSEQICKKFGAFFLLDGNPLTGINNNDTPYQLLCANRPLQSGTFLSNFDDQLEFTVVFEGSAYYNIVGFMDEGVFDKLQGGEPPATGREIYGSAGVKSRVTVCVDARACHWYVRHENGDKTSPTPLPPCAYFFASCKMNGTPISLKFSPVAPRASAASSRASGKEEEEE